MFTWLLSYLQSLQSKHLLQLATTSRFIAGSSQCRKTSSLELKAAPSVRTSNFTARKLHRSLWGFMLHSFVTVH